MDGSIGGQEEDKEENAEHNKDRGEDKMNVTRYVRRYRIHITFRPTFSSFISNTSNIYQTSALIGTWKCNFPSFKNIKADRPTNRPTNLPTNQRTYMGA